MKQGDVLVVIFAFFMALVNFLYIVPEAIRTTDATEIYYIFPIGLVVLGVWYYIESKKEEGRDGKEAQSNKVVLVQRKKIQHILHKKKGGG